MNPADANHSSASLNADRRQREWAELRHGAEIDLLVIGGGVTGAGVALDAASRGLSVVLAEKHDLAFGTSRWSSKLIHGGLRYLGQGEFRVAHESAVERGHLITTIAPHLVHALPNVFPLLPSIDKKSSAMVRAGYVMGDILRAVARTPKSVLPRPRRLNPTEVLDLAPLTRRAGLRGGHVYWDGQLVDDARLVVALARTAAHHGATVLTRCEVSDASGHGATLRDTLTGESLAVTARAVINASGVWAEDLAPDISLRPSRGTHLVFSQETFGGLKSALSFPVEGESFRFVFAMPAPEGRVYVGLTDVEESKPFPDVPTASEDEIEFLLSSISRALDRELTRTDVLATFTGLRPLLNTGSDRTADLSRSHAVTPSPNGLITIVGGKLTTYRRMAEDAVDAACKAADLAAAPCRTRTLALIGAPATGAAALAATAAGDSAIARRLTHRYGTESGAILHLADGRPELLEPIAEGLETTRAELMFAVLHEGALDVDDLLDRRSRIGLVPADRARAFEAAEAVLSEMTAT